jgi:hypothetical protein
MNDGSKTIATTKPLPVRATNRSAQTLDDAICAIATHEGRFRTDVVNVGDLRVERDCLLAGEHEFVFRSGSFARLCAWLQAPPDYLARRPPQLRAELLNHGLRTGDFHDPRMPRNRRSAKAIDRCKLVSRDGAFVAFDRADLTRLDGATVLQAVREGIGAGASDLEPDRFTLTEEGFRLNLISPTVAEEVRPGDIVCGGLQVEHHWLAEAATSVQAFLLRCLCRNGAVAHVCLGTDGTHGSRRTRRIRRLDNTLANAGRQHYDQVRDLAAERFGQLRQHLDQTRAMVGLGTVDVERALEALLRHARMASNQLLNVLVERAWRQEQQGEASYFAAFNAITWLATHADRLDPDEWYQPSESQIRGLERVAGTLIAHGNRYCPSCYSVLRHRSGGLGRVGRA